MLNEYTRRTTGNGTRMEMERQSIYKHNIMEILFIPEKYSASTAHNYTD